MDFLNVSGIIKSEKDKTILHGVDFQVDELEKVAIVGASGAGKSTLLKIVAGLSQADEGAVFYDGSRVKGVDEKLMPGHPGIAYLSQHFELWNNYRVEDVLSYGNKLPEDAAMQLYRICRIDHLLKRYTSQLSGGERQRIAMARLLNGAPGLFILDEPYSNLDLIHKEILKAVIRDLSEQLQITCLLTSHDPMDTLPWADRILVMQQGKIVQSGTPHEIYAQPLSEYTAALFGPYNLINEQDAAVLMPSGKPGKHLLLRPHQMRIVAGGNQALPGTVQRINYHGNCYIVEVLTASKEVFYIQVANMNVQKGSQVHIAINGQETWYI
ncbi:ABC transporter ATP-binding protein [Chitinophaga caeni]|nr:ABC transporter ATP-binding protein [Chitinophaga caeni]